MKRFVLIFCFSFFSLTLFGQPDPEIQANWEKLASALQRRCDFTPNALKTLSASKEVDNSLIVTSDSLRKDFCNYLRENPAPNSSTVSELIRRYRKLTHSFSEVFVSLERDPKFRDLDSTREVLAHWEGIENRIVVYRYEYNEVCKKKGKPELQFIWTEPAPKVIF